MRTAKNLIRHELIGLRMEVVNASNKANVGIKGKVVNETKNVMVIRTLKGIKRIQKKGSEFVFQLKNKKVKVSGNVIIARPEDRIKLKVRKWVVKK